MSAGASSPGQVLEPYGAARLLRAAAERGGGLHTFVRLALTSGARRGELLEVRWPDLYWPDAVGGCGTLSVMCRNGGKTARARRRIAIDPDTMDVLAAWRSESCAAVRATGLDPQGCVFAADMPGESAWNPGRVTRQVTALAAQTGVSAGVAGLRRYGMTRMIVRTHHTRSNWARESIFASTATSGPIPSSGSSSRTYFPGTSIQAFTEFPPR
jgi:integrase